MYEYDAKVLEVVDGDTLKVSFQLLKLSRRFKDRDLGLHLYIEQGVLCLHETVRLLGLNAPEKRTEPGLAAKTWLASLLPPGTPVRVATKKDTTEKYGRWLGTVFSGRGASVNTQLLIAGYATEWDGKGVRP